MDLTYRCFRVSAAVVLLTVALCFAYVFPASAQIFGTTGGGGGAADGAQVECTLSELTSPSSCSSEADGTLVLLTDPNPTDWPNRCDPSGAGSGTETPIVCLRRDGAWVELSKQILVTAAQVKACLEEDVQTVFCAVGRAATTSGLIDTDNGLEVTLPQGTTAGNQNLTLSCEPGSGFEGTGTTDTMRVLDLNVSALEHDFDLTVDGCTIGYSTDASPANETGLTITHGEAPTGTGHTGINAGRIWLQNLSVGESGWDNSPLSAEHAWEYRGDSGTGYGFTTNITVRDSVFRGFGDPVVGFTARCDSADSSCITASGLVQSRTYFKNVLFQGNTTGAGAEPDCFHQQSTMTEAGNEQAHLTFEDVDFQVCDTAVVANHPSITMRQVRLTGIGNSTDDNPIFDFSGAAVLGGEADTNGARTLDLDVVFLGHGTGATDGPVALVDEELNDGRAVLSGNGLVDDGSGWGSGTTQYVFDKVDGTGTGPDSLYVAVFPDDDGARTNMLIEPADSDLMTEMENDLGNIVFRVMSDNAGSCPLVSLSGNHTATHGELARCVTYTNGAASADLTLTLPDHVPHGGRFCVKVTQTQYDMNVDPNGQFLGPPTAGFNELFLNTSRDLACFTAAGEVFGFLSWSIDYAMGVLCDDSTDSCLVSDQLVTRGSGAIAGGDKGLMRWGQSNGTSLNTGDELCGGTAFVCRDAWSLGADGATAWADTDCASSVTSTHRFAAFCSPAP